MTHAMQVIAITAIMPNPDQPRKVFDAETLDELAQSIEVDGLMQPITVRPVPGGMFQIVAGERRWRAHCRLVQRGDPHYKFIRCIVRQMDDLQRDISAIVENLQRVDVTPLEEAHAFRRLIDSGLDSPTIGRKVGVPTPRIEQRLSLLRLDASIIKLVAGGQLDAVSAAEVARIPDAAGQLRIVRMLNRGQISVTAGSRGESLRHAVAAALGEDDVADFFGDAAPPVTQKEQRVLTRMEQTIEEVVRLVASGWKDNECIVANRVNPDRAKTMADKLKLLRNAIRSMERQLRNVTAQAVMKLTGDNE